MKFLFQKVKNLKIYQNKKIIFHFNNEEFIILAYLAFEKNDESKNLENIFSFLENCQIVTDQENKFKLTLKQIKEKNIPLVFVSQITLLAEFNKKGRINFNKSLSPSLAKKIFSDFVFYWRKFGYNVFSTDFCSYLEIESINLGPINFFIEK